MFFYSQPNLTCTRVSHSNPASYSRPREIGQISDLICLFLVDCDRPIVGFTLALNSLISIVFCDQMPEMLLKISQLATFPWKCLALPLLFNIPAFLPKEIETCLWLLKKRLLLISIFERASPHFSFEENCVCQRISSPKSQSQRQQKVQRAEKILWANLRLKKFWFHAINAKLSGVP